MQWRVDGQACFKRFERASDAAAYRQDLLRGYAVGLRYSLDARRFVDDDVPGGPQITVADWTREYWDQKWPTLQPKGRSELARYLSRAAANFVDVERDSSDADDIRAYVTVSLRSDRPEPVLTDREATGRQLLEAGSVPLAAIGRAELQAFVDRCCAHYRNPGAHVSASTIKRRAADLRQCWDRAVIEGHLTSNPWDAVRLGPATGTRVAPVKATDADLVLAPDQVVALAQACVDNGSWGEMSRSLVLVMGFCGLRPSEVVGLIVSDVDVADPADAWLTVRRSHRHVPPRFLAPTEDHDWGPLKSKPERATRRVPIPPDIADVLAAYLTTLDEPRPFDLVFSRNDKPIDPTMFGRFVWNPARAAMFPPHPELPANSPLQPKLARLRRHDLRHAACSMWLHAGTDIKVCQRWSGHSRLSVFLDIYQVSSPATNNAPPRTSPPRSPASTSSTERGTPRKRAPMARDRISLSTMLLTAETERAASLGPDGSRTSTGATLTSPRSHKAPAEAGFTVRCVQ